MCWLTTAGYTFFLFPWYPLKVYQLFKNQIDINMGCKLFIQFKLLFKEDEKRLAKLTLLLSPIWFISGYTWYLSLAHTSVTANTIISNSAFIWTLILSVLLLQEKLSSLKIACCFFCLCGLIIVTIAGNNSEEEGVDQTTMGFILMVISTILNAIYDVFYKRFAPSSDSSSVPSSEPSSPESLTISSIQQFEGETAEEESEEEIANKNVPKVDQEVSFIDNLLFLGLTGFFVTILFWPGIPILNWLDIEEFEIPSQSTSVLLFFNILLDTATTFGTFAAISWTSPMFTDIALLLTIPTSVVFDVLIHNYILPSYGWLGVIMLVFGFICLVLADLLIDYRLSKQKQGETFPKWLDNLLCCSSAFYAVNW